MGFGDLPITYIFRDTPLAPGSIESVEATEELLRTRETALLAILFDDDWWTPNHLERALKGLQDVPDSIASFCLCLATTGEDSYVIQISDSFVPWFASGGLLKSGRYVLSLPDLVVGGLLSTFTPYSSMVVSRNVFLECARMMKTGNPFDTDRMLSVKLGEHGTVLCELTPTVFTRVHEGQETKRLVNSREAHLWWRQTTNQILAHARTHAIDVRKEFSKRLTTTGLSVIQLRRRCNKDPIDYLARNNYLHRSSLDRDWLKDALKNLTPPIIWQLGRRFYRLLTGAAIL
jgi:hypothetical protein